MKVKKIKLLCLACIMILTGCDLEMLSDNNYLVILGAKYNNKALLIDAKENNENFDMPNGFFQVEDSVPLFVAIRNGDLDTIQFIIDNGANVNAAMRNTNLNSLIYTLNPGENNGDPQNTFEIVELLVNNGVDINHRADHHGYKDINATELAYLKSNSRAFSYLLDIGGEFNARSLTLRTIENANQTMLKKAVEHMNENEIETGLDNLVEAAILGDNKKVQKLLKTEKMTSKNENAVLIAASCSCNVETVEMLLNAKKSSVNHFDRADGAKGINIASRANMCSNTEVYKYAIESGQNVRFPPMYADDLRIAVTEGNQEVTKYILDSGTIEIMYDLPDGFIDLRNYDGTYTVYMRDFYGLLYMNQLIQDSPESMKLVIESMGERADEKLLNTMLQISMQENLLETGQYLIDAGANPNVILQNQYPHPLYEKQYDLAIRNGADPKGFIDTQVNTSEYVDHYIYPITTTTNLNVLQKIIDSGADINACSHIREYDDDGETYTDYYFNNALGTAINNGSYDVAKLVLENGARVDAYECQYNNSSALDGAKSRGFESMIELIEKYS